MVVHTWIKQFTMMTMIGVSWWMFLLVSAHTGCPRQNPQSHKVVECVYNGKLNTVVATDNNSCFMVTMQVSSLTLQTGKFCWSKIPLLIFPSTHHHVHSNWKKMLRVLLSRVIYPLPFYSLHTINITWSTHACRLMRTLVVTDVPLCMWWVGFMGAWHWN